MKYDLSNPIEKGRFISRAKQLLDLKCIVDLTKEREVRTIQQNKYLHVLFQLYAIEFGYTLAEAKFLLKSECEMMQYEKKGTFFIKSTSELDTLEMTAFIDWIRNTASMQGCYLPTADEYRASKTMIDKEIDRHNEYL